MVKVFFFFRVRSLLNIRESLKLKQQLKKKADCAEKKGQSTEQSWSHAIIIIFATTKFSCSMLLCVAQILMISCSLPRNASRLEHFPSSFPSNTETFSFIFLHDFKTL